MRLIASRQTPAYLRGFARNSAPTSARPRTCGGKRCAARTRRATGSSWLMMDPTRDMLAPGPGERGRRRLTRRDGARDARAAGGRPRGSLALAGPHSVIGARDPEGRGHGRRPAEAQEPERDLQLSPAQRDADLLRHADAVQPARPRPVGRLLRVHQLLRHLRRPPPALLHAATETGAREFKSMEDVGNYLLGHKEFRATRSKRAAARARRCSIMFDEETEQLCEELGLDMALPPAKPAHPASTPRSRPPSSATRPASPSAPNTHGPRRRASPS